MLGEAAEKASPSAPLLELGGDGWLVMANINAHLMEDSRRKTLGRVDSRQKPKITRRCVVNMSKTSLHRFVDRDGSQKSLLKGVVMFLLDHRMFPWMKHTV